MFPDPNQPHPLSGLFGFGQAGLSRADLEREHNARRAWAEATCEMIPSFIEDLLEELPAEFAVQEVTRKNDGDPPFLHKFGQLSGSAFANEDIELIVTKAWARNLHVEILGDHDNGLRIIVTVPFKSTIRNDEADADEPEA